jgi:hypothetical protein
MNLWWRRFAALSITACAFTGARPCRAGMPAVYVRDIAAPSMRVARSSWCGAIRSKSIPVDRSTEASTEKSEWAGMKLLTEQLDCRYMGAFFAELGYAARHHVLSEGAWQICLRLAPVHKLKTALDLAVYMQCLHVVRGTETCQAVRMNVDPNSGTSAACAQLLRGNDWSQWGEPESRGNPASLFRGDHTPTSVLPRASERILHLPTTVALAGEIRTGFSLNCCLFGVGFMMPFSYLHLSRAVTVSDWVLGTIPIRDIELDKDVAGVLVEKPVRVTCKSLHSGETTHYALSVYCGGTQISRSASRGDEVRRQPHRRS